MTSEADQKHRQGDPEALDEILTVAEIASYLKVSNRTVLRMAKAGRLPSAKVSGQWRFVRALVQECRSRGPLTKALYAVVGFDDGLAIIIFGVASALATSLLAQDLPGTDMDVGVSLLTALREIALSIGVGLAGERSSPSLRAEYAAATTCLSRPSRL